MTHQLPTNFSNGTIVQDLGTFIQYADVVSGTWLAEGFLLIIFLMTLGIGTFAGAKKSFPVACFITMIFSAYFLRLEMINSVITFTLLVLTIVGAFLAKEGGGSY